MCCLFVEFCLELYWINPRSKIPQNSSCMATHLPSVKSSKLDEHYWSSKDELISDVLPWTPSHGQVSVGRPARTYLQQLCTGTWCSVEDLPEAMDDRDEWRERVREICVSGTTWYIYSDMHMYRIHVIFYYNSSLYSPFWMIFGK